MKRVAWRWVVCAAATAVVSGTVGYGTLIAAEPAKPAAANAGQSERNIASGITLPFKEYKISFPTMGVIREVKIKEGDVVKKSDVLMVQDDREERGELKLLELDVNDYPIEAAKAKLRVAEVEFQMKENMKKLSAGSELEWEHAKAEMEVAKIQVEASKRELMQKEAKRDKQAQHVKSMSLEAGVDGVIKDLINDLGSNVDPTKPVVTIVENNPIVVEVYVPALSSLQLKKGEKLRVSYDKKNWKEATVNYLSPQADASAGTRMIHLELPNPDGDPSGLQAFVELPEKLLASAEGK